MEERRFDDLTRALGSATSRRQVLKGLLGGLGAALVGTVASRPPVAAAAGCNVAQCERDATKDLVYFEKTTCRAMCRPPGIFEGGMGACIGCQITARRHYRAQLDHCRTGDGCLAGHACCEGACVDIGSDPHNCGSCLNVCSPGEACVHGQCQCGDQGTVCDGQCTDTQIDAKHCGSCDHACDTCQTCVDGICVDVDCGIGNVCCNNQCVATCPSGKRLDPQTCECVCTTGEACGPYCCADDKICCPDTLSGMSCRDPEGDCGCGVPCGGMCCDQYQFCCRAADYSYHCVGSSGDSC